MADLKQQLEEALRESGAGEASFSLPDDLSHGDLSTNAALKNTNLAGQNSHERATLLIDKLREREIYKNVELEVAGPGFINLTFSPELLSQLAEQISQLEGKVLSGSLVGQTILVEYSQPNIAKPMHVGHLRTTVIGEALKRMLAALGAKAIGLNHLGDWGSQFGKLLVAYKKWGSPEILKRGSLDDLLKLYIRFHNQLETNPDLAKQGAAEFAKLEAGDKENRKLWERMRAISIQALKKIYARLDITLDEPELGESRYEDRLGTLIADALQRGIAKESEGAVIIPVGDDLPPCLIRKSDGATLYATRDLAAIEDRILRWHPNRIIYVVAADQSLHFQQVFRAAERLGLAPGVELVHIPYGLAVDANGKKFSTREGRLIHLETLLDEAVERARKLVTDKSPDLSLAERDRVAEMVGLGAIKYQDLKNHRLTTVVFDWEWMLTLQGNTGPYLQYTVARAQSVLAKAPDVHPRGVHDLKEADEVELTLVRLAIRLPWIVEQAAQVYAPNHLADWLYHLAATFNRFYEDHPILEGGAARDRRLAITNLVAQSLRRGLDLLGIEAPDRL